MICPTCHGNGYLLEESDDGRVPQIRDVTQCATCSSSGEVRGKEYDDQLPTHV